MTTIKRSMLFQLALSSIPQSACHSAPTFHIFHSKFYLLHATIPPFTNTWVDNFIPVSINHMLPKLATE